MNFERMTERARQVMRRAKEEAQRMGCKLVFPEHILLGLINEADSVAVTALKNLGVDLSLLRKKTQSHIKNTSNHGDGGSTQLSPSGKQALQFAHQEAEALGVNFIATEHLLLGVIRENESVAAQALSEQGVDLAKARAEILRLMGGGAEAGEVLARQCAMTTRCEAILRRAKDTALRWGGPSVSTEYLLLGLLDEPGTKALALLLELGVHLSRLREKTLQSVAHGNGPEEEDKPPQLAASGNAFILGHEEAGNCGLQTMDTEHLLVGLLLVQDGHAARLLQEEGVTLEKIRAELKGFETRTGRFFL